MKLSEKLSSLYPYRRRILAAVILICFSAWDLYKAQHVTGLELIVVSVVVIAALSGTRSRLFWLMLGIALGILLALIVPQLHF